ncbi:hypothetical protein Gogos_020565 [Gossypium gossypioides]|uniref:Uncharacterized protein n=1 Tax=Gossypium gossypioides TaxID=34282 RepID=A0A7J9D3Z6_GOSGO|nr:hypothetical protein [Gossypium gossypioides]
MRSFVKVRGVNVLVTETNVQSEADDTKGQDVDEIHVFKNITYNKDV